MGTSFCVSAYRQADDPWIINKQQTLSGATWSEARQCRDESKARRTEQVRKLLRELNRTDETKSGGASGRSDAFSELMGTKESDGQEPKIKKPVNYNFKDVSARIQRAKTSVSAAQAVLAAKRKVLDLKRKISALEGDPEELQMALTHAQRMEMVARKKKNHLELEELAGNNIKRDERADRQEEAARELKRSLVAEKEDKVSSLEDEIFDDRQDMIDEAAEQAEERIGKLSDEAFAELNEMISGFGEEEMRILEEAMEMLEDMEVMDPHITREELDSLKKKHRIAEQKAMVKADMDYLKGMIKQGGVISSHAPVSEGAAIDVQV